MTDLILHIGLSKCASTTLQRKVFCHESGYLGTARGLAPEDNLGGQLLTCGPFQGRQNIDRRGLEQWADRVRKRHSECCPNKNRLILSQEMLSAASRLDDRPILKVLSILKNQFWSEGQVKVVLILRNQASRLASSYAQLSNTIWHAGQLDFEGYVKRHMSSRRNLRLLDYSSWVDGLNEVVGSKNVCLLLLEDAQTHEFWQRLADFCHLEQLEPTSMISQNQGSENVRRSGTDRWSIQPLDIEFRARAITDKWLNLVWPAATAHSLRDRYRLRIIEAVKKMHAHKLERLKLAPRETEIHLSRIVMQSVRDNCGQANKRLAVQLGRDLKQLGY